MKFNHVIKSLLAVAGLRVLSLKRHPDAYQTQVRVLGEVSPAVIFDIGANVGQTYRKYRRLFPTATIHSFEPFREAYDQLANAVLRDRYSHAHQLAVSDHSGDRTLFISKKNQMNSLLRVTKDGIPHMGGDEATVVGEAQVPTITLDGYCAEHNIKQIDILKMDVQGGELGVLRGAEGLLRSRAVRLIYSEVLFAECYAGAPMFDELWQHLRERGYALHSLHELTLGTNGMVGNGDAIFVSQFV